MRRRKGSFGKIGLLSLALVLALGTMGAVLARSTETLWINGTVNTRVSGSGEAPGFWKNWDSHNTYSEEEIEVWLASINGTSDWLGPTTVEDMVAAFVVGEEDNATVEEKFLRQYLATRLNVAAGGLSLTTFHLFSIYDLSDYLDLAGQNTLEQIIDAIEDKYETSPTPAEFEVMKNICEFLNEQHI